MLKMLNAKIVYIKDKRNKITDELSRVIFYNKNCLIDDIVRKIFKEVIN